MKKRWIEDAAIFGLRLDLRDVARVGRRRSKRVRVVTLRHAWPDHDVDARVWAGISAALSRGARDIMLDDARVDEVEVWSRNGGWLFRTIVRDDVC